MELILSAFILEIRNDISSYRPHRVQGVDHERWHAASDRLLGQGVARQKAFIAGLGDVLGAPVKLEDVQPGQYDVLFIVGGHGPMQDLAVHPTIGNLLAANLADPRKIVGGVCHGPAGFLSAHRADGSWLFKGRRLTAFTNEEETGATFAGNAPWLLEDRLRLAGAQFEGAPAWSVHVVADGNLVTGQQNNSSGAAATKILEQLKASA